jgi:hypothetical protein
MPTTLATSNEKTRELLAVVGAAILSFGFMWWIGGRVFVPNAPPQVVETRSASLQPNLASDYQQRLDLYYQRRAESESQRQTPTGGYVSGGGQTPVARADAPIRQAIIRDSIAKYQATGHPCASPYNLMRNGRQCGDRSAYSRPGGASPLCYPQDVSDGAVAAWKRAHP